MKTVSFRGWVTLLALLLAATSAGLAALNQRNIAKFRAEQAALSRDRDEAQRLARENGEMGRLRGEAAEAQVLRDETTSLPALRNEVTQLRKKTNDFAMLRAEHDRLLAQSKALPNPASRPAPALPPAGFISKADLRDVGLASPEAALQTYYWAMREGNLEALKRCEVNGKWNHNGDAQFELRQLADRMSSFNGYFIADRRQVSEVSITLVIQGSVNGPALSMHFKLVENEWQFDQ